MTAPTIKAPTLASKDLKAKVTAFCRAGALLPDLVKVQSRQSLQFGMEYRGALIIRIGFWGPIY